MKSEALENIQIFRINTLKSLLLQCTEKQQDFFWRLYPSYNRKVESFPSENIDWAIQQCENTIAKNKSHEGLMKIKGA